MSVSVSNAAALASTPVEDAKALVRRYLEEIVPSGDVELLDEVFATGLVAYLGERSASGIQVMRDYVAAFH